MLLICYASFIYTGFKLLSCRTIDNKRVLQDAPSVECFANIHILISIVAICTIVIFSILIPVIIFYNLSNSNMGSIGTMEVILPGQKTSLTGSLYKNAKKNVYPVQLNSNSQNKKEDVKFHGVENNTHLQVFRAPIQKIQTEDLKDSTSVSGTQCDYQITHSNNKSDLYCFPETNNFRATNESTVSEEKTNTIYAESASNQQIANGMPNKGNLIKLLSRSSIISHTEDVPIKQRDRRGVVFDIDPVSWNQFRHPKPQAHFENANPEEKVANFEASLNFNPKSGQYPLTQPSKNSTVALKRKKCAKSVSKSKSWFSPYHTIKKHFPSIDNSIMVFSEKHPNACLYRCYKNSFQRVGYVLFIHIFLKLFHNFELI